VWQQSLAAVPETSGFQQFSISLSLPFKEVLRKHENESFVGMLQ
jgi:hypothetical protein